jgi:hypothetical protein
VSENTEVTNNEYGIPNDEYEEARQAARAAARGEEVEQSAAEAPPTKEEVEVPEAQEPQTPAAQTAETQADPLSDIPEDLREKVASLLKAKEAESEKYKQKYQSDIGRIDAYQRKYEEARRKSEDAERQLAALKKTPTKSLKEIAPGPRIKEALEHDEVLVETLDEVRDQIRKELEEQFTAELDKRLAPIAEHRQHEEQERFTQELDRSCENWRDVVFAKDEHGRIVTNDKGAPVFNEGWATFVDSQPLPIRQAILNPTSPDEALWAFEQYQAWGTRHGYFEQPAEETQRSESAPLPNADAILKKRQEDLKRNAPPRQNQVPLANAPLGDNPNDEDRVAYLRKKAREALAKGDLSIYRNAR